MTYMINKSNGELLATIADGTIDKTTTSIDLIGKDSINFGKSVNTNFVKLLDNFASTTSPEYPLKGQLWYDVATGSLKVYDGTSFRLSGGAIVSPIMPPNMNIGDFWIHNGENKLYFWDGKDAILVGPGYSIAQGKTGVFPLTVIDSQSRDQVISTVMVSGSVVGIFSKTTFTPYLPISGFAGEIKPGFTLSSLISGNINSNSKSASALMLSDGTLKSGDVFMYADSDNVVDGSLIIQNDAGLTIGALDNLTLTVSSNKSIITNAISDAITSIRVNKTIGSVVTSMDAITIKSNTKAVGIFNENPISTLDIAGDVTVRGNLQVTGASMPLIISIDVTGQSDVDAYVISQLIILAPNNIYGNGTVARVHCIGGSPLNRTFELIDSTWTHIGDL